MLTTSSRNAGSLSLGGDIMGAHVVGEEATYVEATGCEDNPCRVVALVLTAANTSEANSDMRLIVASSTSFLNKVICFSKIAFM
jgi:hypothetical protein